MLWRFCVMKMRYAQQKPTCEMTMLHWAPRAGGRDMERGEQAR